MLEKAIEQSFLRKMKKAFPFLRVPKLTMLSQRSWPDRLIPIPNGGSIYIEFKREGEKPTPLQEDCHEYLRGLGQDVQVFDNAEAAYQYVRAKLLESHGSPK